MCHGRITVLGGSWNDYLRYRDFYHYRKHKARPDTLMADSFLATMTDQEKTVMGQHMAYTQQLFDRGKIVLSGAATDGAIGVLFHQGNLFK
jgi:hypothetical protein